MTKVEGWMRLARATVSRRLPSMYNSSHDTSTSPSPRRVAPGPTAYFVLMCLSFPGEYKKLLAYALGTNFRSLGSCTKYS